MNSSLQDAIKEAYAIAPSKAVILNTLEINQVGQDPIYLVQAARGISAMDENGDEHLFEPSGFQFTLPPSTEEGFQSLNIAIDNVNQRASDFLQEAQSILQPVKIIYRPYLSDDLTAPQMIPPLVLYLKDVRVTATQVSGRATFMDIVNMKFPLELYTRERFPTLG